MTMNWANPITLGRLILTGLFLICISLNQPAAYRIALILFLLASLTDAADGIIARKSSRISLFGICADTVADKILIATALICFVQIPDLKIPAWPVVLIIAREFLILGLRILGATSGNIPAAEVWGKWKMLTQTLAVLAILLYLAAPAKIPLAPPLPMALIFLAAAATWISGILYLQHHWNLLKGSWIQPPASLG